MNLLRKETPEVKADPLRTQQNTTLAEVDQDTLLTEKPTNVVKYNLGKANLKATLVSTVFPAMLGWPTAFSRGIL